MEKRKVIKRLLKSMRFIQLAVISSLKSFFALCYSPSHEIHVSICGGEHRPGRDGEVIIMLFSGWLNGAQKK